jgi:nicotinate-nucleotide--dimethylbenzimidazole phosphoribosyltransferase
LSNWFQERLASIQPVDHDFEERARVRLDDLTKPVGSLGRLEDLILRLSGIRRELTPTLDRLVCLLFAADHGVTAEGVSAYPPEVTAQMVVNIVSGGAVSSVLARQHGVKLRVVDVGVRVPVEHPEVVSRKVALGTRNFAHGPAMTRAEAEEAVAVGMAMADEAVAGGCQLLLVGEMGIGNTTAAAALVALLCDCPIEQVVGAGTGITEDRRKHKADVIRRAIEVNQPLATDPWDVLSKLGGLEIAAIAGAILSAAGHRIPVLLDGLMTGVAALWASRCDKRVGDYLIASHVSAEPAHRMVLRELGLKPLLDLEMRLGEASGALLALPLVESACRVMAETATFSSAGVSSRHDG